MFLLLAGVQTAQAGKLYARAGRLANGFFLRPAIAQQAGDLQSAGRAQGGNDAVQMLADRVEHAGAAPGIQLAHGPDMGVVMAVFHKARQGQLQDLRCVTVHHAARIGEGFDQFVGQYHVAHSQPRVEGLAEGADVERALVLVQALYAGGRLPVVVKLAVVVIFDDPFALLRRPVDQLKTTLQRQGRAGGVLMRRRDIDAMGAASVGVQQVGAYAQFIDINGQNPGLGGFKGLPGAVVTRVFQQDRFADIHQQLRTQKKGLASAAQHHDLVGGAFGSALKVQVGGNRLAQRLGALRVAMQQHIGAILLHDPALQALPDIGGEGAGFRQAGRKCLDHLLIVHTATVEDHPPALAQARPRCRLAAFDFLGLDAATCHASQFSAHRFADITAGPLAPHDKTVPVQLHVGVLHGVAGNPE